MRIYCYLSLIHLPINGLLGYFHLLAIVNNSAINKGAHVPFGIPAFSPGYMPACELDHWVLW